jgi:hypothetical protein
MATPVDVARVEDVTGEHLRGASQWELAAFGMAVLEYILDAGVDEWTALAVAWDGGAWRQFVAERCPSTWQLARRRIAREREGESPPA